MPRWTRTEAERFWSKVEKTDGCWLWTASCRRGGYGQFWSASAQAIVGAHRWAYEQEHGAIADGLFLDHLCRNPRCVNPAHLEPVTNRENLLRGDNPASRNARKTHCPHGHPFDGANVRVVAGKRRCVTCDRRRSREQWRRRQAAGATR